MLIGPRTRYGINVDPSVPMIDRRNPFSRDLVRLCLPGVAGHYDLASVGRLMNR